MSDTKDGVYALMDEVRSAISSLDYITKELRNPKYESKYSSDIKEALTQREQLSRALHALSKIESSVYSYESEQMKTKNKDFDPSTPSGHRMIQKSVATKTSPGADIEVDDSKDSALVESTSRLVDEIRKSISPDLTSMIGRITQIESDIQKLQVLVKELKQRAVSVKTMPDGAGLLKRLQDAITLASQVTGTVTIRGIRHTIETYTAEEPVAEMFTSRFQNLDSHNLVFMSKPLHKDFTDRINRSSVYNTPTSRKDKVPRSYKFISLIPTTSTTLGLPADKAVSSILHDIVEQVKNKTYTFNTHDPITYEESDSGNDIVFDMSGITRKTPSYLEEAILRLSLEYLDVIHKYLLTTEKTTSGYVAILPCSVFGMKLSAKLFHSKTPGRFSRSTGEENKKSMGDLVAAYNIVGNERQQLPHIAYAHTNHIKSPVYNLEKDSEKVYSSTLPKTISMLGQLYVRFARKSSAKPLIKVGLQDTIAGSAVLYDFPNFKISHVYNAFSGAKDTITVSEATKRRNS